MNEIKYIKNPIDYLRKTGLLFEINRQVLHPLGLAIAVQLPEEGEQDIEFGVISILDCTEDPEGLVYGEDTFNNGIEKFQKYMDEEGDARLASRVDELGFYVQSIPDPHYLKNGITLTTTIDGRHTSFKVPAKWLELKVVEWFDIGLEEFLQVQVGYDIQAIYEEAKKENAFID